MSTDYDNVRTAGEIIGKLRRTLADPEAPITHETSTRHHPLTTVRLIYERANVRKLSAILQEEGSGGEQWALVRVFCTPQQWQEITAGYQPVCNVK